MVGVRQCFISVEAAIWLGCLIEDVVELWEPQLISVIL